MDNKTELLLEAIHEHTVIDRETAEILCDRIREIFHTDIVTQGTGMIIMERAQQLYLHKFDARRDSRYVTGQLALAAAAYALPDDIKVWLGNCHIHIPRKTIWPDTWKSKYFAATPQDRISEVVKAGALCAAEVDRLILSQGITDNI